MPYIEKEALEKAHKLNAPVVVDIEEICIVCNKQSYWTLLAIHTPDMIWMCYSCYNRSHYNHDIDYITINDKKIYWWWMMYKIWRGFIPINEVDGRWLSE